MTLGKCRNIVPVRIKFIHFDIAFREVPSYMRFKEAMLIF